PMDDAQRTTLPILELMRVVDPRENIDEDAEVHLLREGRACPIENAMKGLPIQILHREEIVAFRLPCLPGLNHVRLAQSRQKRALGGKHLRQLCVAREVFT